MPTDETAGREAEPFRPSPETFDETFGRVAAGRVVHELFDRAMGPFPANVEPFSLVTREGLDRVFAELQLQEDDHLVDLCCGRGGIGLWFAMEARARLTGVDFSPVAIAEAQRRAERFLPNGDAVFVVADASETSLARGSADAVVCIDALQMLPDREAALREAGALLRDDGRIVLTTWELDVSPSGRTPLADAGHIVEAAGLHLVLREEHPEWLERQTALYESATAADGDNAEPAVTHSPRRAGVSCLLHCRTRGASWSSRASLTNACHLTTPLDAHETDLGQCSGKSPEIAL